MSHPDPLFDPDNAYDDNHEIYHEDGVNYIDDELLDRDPNYDDHDDFWYDDANRGDDTENSGEVDWCDEDEYNDDMDGDHDSAMTSCGWGTDEDYGYYGEDVDYREDFHSDDGYGYYDDGE